MSGRDAVILYHFNIIVHLALVNRTCTRYGFAPVMPKYECVLLSRTRYRPYGIRTVVVSEKTASHISR